MTLLIAVPLLVLLLVAVSLLWDPVASWRLAACVEALRRGGEPVTLEELAGRHAGPLPAQDATGLFRQAFEAMERNADPALVRELPLVGEGVLPDAGEPVAPELVEGVRAYLRSQAESLRLLREAVARDGCKFDAGLWIDPELAFRMQWAVRLFGLEAFERTVGGEPDAAAESLRAVLRCGHALRRQPFGLVDLLRTKCARVALAGLERLVSQARPSSRALLRLEAALRDEAQPQRLEHALVGIRCMMINVADEDLVRSATRRPLSLADCLEGKRGSRNGTLSRVPVPLASTSAEKLYITHALTACITATRKPYPESLLGIQRVGAIQEANIPIRYSHSRECLPGIADLARDLQRILGNLESARIALAMLRYKAEHRRLPGRLEDLVPDFVEYVLPGPFTGKPLRYLKARDGFVVYYPGRNGHDDGGRVQWNYVAGVFSDLGFRVRWTERPLQEQRK